MTLVRNFEWVEGVSYSARRTALELGMTRDEFVAFDEKTVDSLRRTAGLSGTDGPATKIAQSWSKEQKTEAAKELLADDEVVSEVVLGLPAASLFYSCA